MNWEQLVKEFHVKYDHQISYEPKANIDKKLLELRERLHNEELDELTEAMYLEDIVEIADGIADLIYVLIGTSITYGIPIDKVFREVHRSNMTKAGKRADGKTIKGPNFEPPEIAEILEKAGSNR